MCAVRRQRVGPFRDVCSAQFGGALLVAGALREPLRQLCKWNVQLVFVSFCGVVGTVPLFMCLLTAALPTMMNSSASGTQSRSSVVITCVPKDTPDRSPLLPFWAF